MVPQLAPMMVATPATIQERQPVVQALQRLRQDIDALDDEAGRKPRLGPFEGLTLLGSAALAAASPPLLSEKLGEVLIPACALLVAAIGVSAEYGGRVATANGKEVAALSLRSAAEAEALLASAERSKSVIPLTVGCSAAASVIALVVPALLDQLGMARHTELMLVCPIASMFSSAVAALAELECVTWSKAAQNLGRRRFATRSNVGRSWQSQTEMVFNKDLRERQRWASFVWGISPAPLVALLVRGGLGFKAIVATASAAVQAAYYFASAENAVARATASVAIKARTAAVADTYANQASRISALLPFTSALAGLCAAVATVLVEVQPTVSAIFPTLGALCAAAASVSKACCQADAAAARTAVDELGFKRDEETMDVSTKAFLPILKLWPSSTSKLAQPA